MDLKKCTTPERIAASVDRAQILMGLALANGEPVAPERCVGYAECEKAYEELRVAEGRALDGLLHAMGDPTSTVVRAARTNEQDIKQYRSWHLRRGYQLPDRDETVDLVYEVEANVADRRLDSNRDAANAVRLKTHVLHRPSHGYTEHITHYMSGLMAGSVLYGQFAESVTLSKSAVQVRDMDVLVAEVAQKIRKESPAEAVEAWVDDFIDMCEKYGPTPFEGMRDTVRISVGKFTNIFTEPNASENRREIVGRLAEAFDARNTEYLVDLLKVSPQLFREDMNLTHRVNWVLKNALSIRKAVDDKINQNLTLRFKERFFEKLEEEAKRIAEVTELTEALPKETVLINDCAPTKTPPASPGVTTRHKN